MTDKDLITQLGVSEDTAAWANWLTQPGIYKVTIRSDDSACPPTTDGRDFVFIVMPGAPNATTQTAVTQIAINRRTRAVHLRYASGYTGSGSLASTASAWVEVSDGLSVTENMLDSSVRKQLAEAGVAVKIKGDIGRSWSVTSEDETINGKTILDCTVKPGWIFTVSENLSMSLPVNPNEDVYETLNLSDGDMVMVMDSRCDYVDAWRFLYDSSMKSRITELETQLSLNTIKIRGSLNGLGRTISDDSNYNGFDIDVMPNVRPGDAFTVSEDQTSWWGSANPPKAGDMIISNGNNPGDESNWIIVRGAGATKALESRIVALEQKLSGI